MSSNIRLQKVCQECGREFTAKTSVTKFCSHQCNSRHYKRGKRENFLDIISMREREHRAHAAVVSNTNRKQPRKAGISISSHSSSPNQLTRELLDIQELAIVIGMSERSIYRLLKDDSFPRLRVGKRILFQKNDVLNYLTTKK